MNVVSLPVKRISSKPKRKAPRRDDDHRLKEITAAVTESLGRHFSEIWTRTEDMLLRIRQLMDQSESSIRATGVVSERDLYLLDVVTAMFENLPQLETAEERWRQSAHTDTSALLGMLRAVIPPALFDGLSERLQRQPSKHALRWALVHTGHYVKKLPWPDSYGYASEQLAGTSAAGGRDTMERSYKLAKRRARLRF